MWEGIFRSCGFCVLLLGLFLTRSSGYVNSGLLNGKTEYKNADNIVNEVRNFYIDFKSNTFIKDGAPFRYVSGSIHYFRILRPYWNDVLRKAKMMGLNAICTYIEWSSHQPSPSGELDFSGDLDLFHFLDLAEENNLLVILRPGPFIDAERDMGGLPPWLLWEKPGMKIRSSDLDFIYFVSRWYDVLLPRLKPYLYANGGPVIMMQVENEYGSFGCDQKYTEFLRDLIRFHFENKVVLFTTDGAGPGYVKCGHVTDVYSTVDFGVESQISVNFSFVAQRLYSPSGPLINSEFYPGWLDHWNYPHNKVDSKKVVSTLKTMLDMGANVNFYMFIGGTSFGYKAGANVDNGVYNACPTSYDYDALLTESREPTLKYFAVQELLSKYFPLPKENSTSPKTANYGKVALRPVGRLISPEILVQFQKIISNRTMTFEQLRVGSGFVLYETVIKFLTRDPSLLELKDLKDRAYVYVDEVYRGTLSRTEKILSMPLTVKKEQVVRILVENQGRVCFGSYTSETKGLSQVLLGNKVITDWNIYPIGEIVENQLIKSFNDFTNYTPEEKYRRDFHREGGTILVGTFNASKTLAENGLPQDTFVLLKNFEKGIIWVNGFNLGKYWITAGPQKTLYVPGSLLKFPPAENRITILELQAPPQECFTPISTASKCAANFIPEPMIDEATPHSSLHSISSAISKIYTISNFDTIINFPLK